MIKLKGYTSWAIGMSVAIMSQALLRNQKNVHAISTLAKVKVLLMLGENVKSGVFIMSVREEEKEVMSERSEDK